MISKEFKFAIFDWPNPWFQMPLVKLIFSFHVSKSTTSFKRLPPPLLPASVPTLVCVQPRWESQQVPHNQKLPLICFPPLMCSSDANIGLSYGCKIFALSWYFGVITSFIFDFSGPLEIHFCCPIISCT